MPLPPLVPLSHLFDNPERAAARLSPDGRTISYLAPRDGVLNLWVRSREGGDDRPVTDDRDRGIRSYFWSRHGRYLLYAQDRGGDENAHVYALDPARPDVVRDLTPFPGVRAGIVAAPRATPRHVLVSMNLRDRSVFDVYRLTLSTGRRVPVAENPGDVIGWTADRAGRLRAAFAQTPEGDYEIRVRDDEAGPFRVVARYDNEDKGYVFGFTPDGRGCGSGAPAGPTCCGWCCSIPPPARRPRSTPTRRPTSRARSPPTSRASCSPRCTCATAPSSTPTTRASARTGTRSAGCTTATR